MFLEFKVLSKGIFCIIPITAKELLNMQTQDRGVVANEKTRSVIVVTINLDGKDVKQPINKKFLKLDGSVNENILVIVKKILQRIRSTEEMTKERNPSSMANRCFETDIAAMAEVRHQLGKKLPRLRELLKFLEDGTFSVNCTLFGCPHHSKNNGSCDCEENLIELLKVCPEEEGCAKGRTFFGPTERRYGALPQTPKDVRVTVPKKHPQKPKKPAVLRK